MKQSSTFKVLLLAALLALVVPAVASAARPPSNIRAAIVGTPLDALAPAPRAVGGPLLAVSRLSSVPAGAAVGHAYTLHGRVTNSGTLAARGPVVVHLMRPGTRPRVVGKTTVRAGLQGTVGFDVTVRIPSRLAKGTYSLFACVHNAGTSGPLGCVSTLQPIKVGGGDAVRGPKSFAAFNRTASAAETCTSGARTHNTTLGADKLYPETGNGGYVSVHTDVFQVYNADTNLFLPGNHVDLTQRATQCLSDFSLDFVRSTTNDAANGPNLTISSITVDGQPATWTFTAPAYPGDPNGPDDPNPLAHQASQNNPVSATNPLPPACSPQLPSSSSGAQNSLNGTQCPAEKLVITPATPVASGATFVVSIAYTGKPGTYRGGGGTQEGWFRDTTAGALGAMVTTEPVGTMAWMPLNNHPTAKPTYDYHDQVTAGRTAIANGELVGFTDNPPDANFPAGSRTWNWHSPEPVQNYLVENSIGAYDLSMRTAASGIQYYEAQSSGIATARKATNKIAMDNQEDILTFQSTLTGPFPFSSDGITVVLPNASFEEEMQTKIVFVGGTIGGTNGTSLGTFNHENFHQWWGDSVAESNYNETFFKEGQATISEYYTTARQDAIAAGGIGTPAGDTAFENRLRTQFNGTGNYQTTSTTFWTIAPSNPTAFSQFGNSNTYVRGGTAYTALWKVFGKAAFVATETKIQHDFKHGNIAEDQLKAYFHAGMPIQSASCHARLTQFFTQWFDTAYAAGGTNTLNRPTITGPGLNGQGFPCAAVSPASPDGANGWYKSPVTLTWSGFPTPPTTGTTAQTATKTGCVDETVAADGTYDRPCTVSSTLVSNGANSGTSGPVSETFKIDATLPVTVGTIAPAAPTGLNGWYLAPPTVTLAPSDATSGLASTLVSLDGGPYVQYSGPISPSSEGGHSVSFYSTDNAGNVEPTQTITWAVDTTAPTTTATLTPGIHNGWYASPTLTLTVDDGHGSGDITDPCPPHVICAYSTQVSVDGGAFRAYEPPEHFGTGNHFVQYRTTDAAGRVEATKLIAFKADSVKPSVNITAPADGAVYPLDKVVTAKFKCVDNESGMDTCVGTVANGANLSTSTVGTHTFTVTGTDKAGNVTTVTHHYQVVYTWNGFFSPVTNSEDSKLNLVHAGDLVKVGFSLNGNRGLNVFAAGFPTSVPVACPSWAPHSVPAGGAGTTAGLSYGASSGHYTYGFQTSASWAGTCREFQIQLNDGTTTIHRATFMFFA